MPPSLGWLTPRWDQGTRWGRTPAATATRPPRRIYRLTRTMPTIPQLKKQAKALKLKINGLKKADLVERITISHAER